MSFRDEFLAKIGQNNLSIDKKIQNDTMDHEARGSRVHASDSEEPPLAEAKAKVDPLYPSKDDPKWQQFINWLKTLYFAGDAKILVGHPKRVKARTKCALLDPRILLEFPEKAKAKFQERMNEHPECVLLLYKDDVILYPEERIQILNTQQGLF